MKEQKVQKYARSRWIEEGESSPILPWWRADKGESNSMEERGDSRANNIIPRHLATANEAVQQRIQQRRIDEQKKQK